MYSWISNHISGGKSFHLAVVQEEQSLQHLIYVHWKLLSFNNSVICGDCSIIAFDCSITISFSYTKIFVCICQYHGDTYIPLLLADWTS